MMRAQPTEREQMLAEVISTSVEGEKATDAIHAMLLAMCAVLEAAYPDPVRRLLVARLWCDALIDMLTSPPAASTNPSPHPEQR